MNNKIFKAGLFCIILFSVVVCCLGCEDENVRKLRNEVRSMAAECPIVVGNSLTVLKEALFDETDHTVTLKFEDYTTFPQINNKEIKEVPKKIYEERLKLWLHYPGFHDILTDIANAHASLNVSVQWGGIEMGPIDLSYDEIVKIKDTQLTVLQIDQKMFANGVKMLNSNLPRSFDNGIVWKKAYVQSGYYTFIYSVNIPEIDRENWKSVSDLMLSNYKTELSETFTTPEEIAELKEIIDCGFGIKYIYQLHDSDLKTEIVITPEEAMEIYNSCKK